MSSRLRIVLPLLGLGATAVLLFSQGTSGPPVMFRGDARHSGVYPGTAASSFGGLRWRVQTDGPVRSSPAVTAEAVFVGSNDGHLYAFDRATGALRWQSPRLGAISSSPAVADGIVVVTSPGAIVAYRAKDGKELWREAEGAVLALPWGHESGDRYLGSPVIDGATVICGGGDGRLRALRLSDGKVLWQTDLATRLRSSPAVSGGIVVIGGADGRVYATALGSGKLLWHFDTEGHALNSADFGFDRRTVQSSPAIVDSLVVVGARDGFVYGIGLRDGRERWRMDHHVSWINASPALDAGLAIAGTSDGHFIQAIDLKDGKERWRTPSVNIVWSSAAIAGTLVYVGEGSGTLYALDEATGAVHWSWRAGGGIFSSPAVADSTLYVGSDDGGIYALALTAGPALRRAVFHDTSAANLAFFRGQDPVNRWLMGHGYEALTLSTLKDWLTRQASDGSPSVVVFAMDVLPAADTAAFRNYLAHGGKVIWLGVPPLLWPRQPDGGVDLKDVNRDASTKLLGVSFEHGNFDPGGAIATEAGNRWGLPRWFIGNWGAETGTVSEVLAVDDEGRAAAWVQSFGGRRGTGFVRLFGTDWGEVNGRIPSALSVQVAAELFPR